MISCILSLDQGSTDSKAGLIDQKGRLVRSYSIALRTFYPKPLWVEHNPQDILNSQVRSVQRLLKLSGKQKVDIAAVGMAAQRSTIVVWNKETGRPVAPAISWQDLRGAGEVEKFSAHRGMIKRSTGLLLSPYYGVLKLRWILNCVKGVRQQAEKGKILCGTVNTYLLWHFTRGEVHATDPTHGARMLLMNLKTLNWDPMLLSLFEIPSAILPSIQPTVSDFGFLKIGHQKIPIRACVGDQQGALAGLGAFQKGEAVINYGTGGFLVVNTREKLMRLPGLLTSVAWSTAKKRIYALEGTVNGVGTMFDWLVRLGLLSSSKEISRMVRLSKHRVFLIPALGGVGAPHWLSDVKMGILGLGPWITRADMVRAGVEGIAFLVKDIHEVIQKKGKINLKTLRASGGLSRVDPLLQTQADWLGLSIQRAEEKEATLLGAGLLAGLGTGWWRVLSEIQFKREGKKFKPRISSREREKLYDVWKRAFASVRVFRSDE